MLLAGCKPLCLNIHILQNYIICFDFREMVALTVTMHYKIADYVMSFAYCSKC